MRRKLSYNEVGGRLLTSRASMRALSSRVRDGMACTKNFGIYCIQLAKKMKKLFIVSFLLSFTSFDLFAETTNCTARERIVFSCTAGKKTVSVCAAPEKAPDDYVEYRFKSDNKLKLAYRADQFTLPHRFNRATLKGASSSTTVLWFENQGYLYAVSDPVKGIPSLTVQKAKKEISSTACVADVVTDLEIENRFIKDMSESDYFYLFN